jgi:hypothetical protein
MDPDNHLDTCHVIGYTDKFVMPVPMKLIVSILQNQYKLGQYELLFDIGYRTRARGFGQ